MVKTLSTQGLEPFLSGIAVVQQLSSEQQRELLRCSQLLSFSQRSILQRSGTPHHHLYIVVAGQLEMCTVSPGGDELVVAVFGPGAMSSWVALFHRQAASRELVATAESRVLACPAATVKQLLEHQPELYPLVLEMEGLRFRTALNRQQLSLQPERSKRIAGLLLMFAEISGDVTATPRVRLTAERLAKVAQCSRQMLYLSIKALQQRGWIEQQYGQILIHNRDALQSFIDS
ncbi:Crp/Fnr family transcriptional regulator [Gammaproteobacteria bacterium LSUCC0057]|uniref:Crp/Fnr family transcriptional regulator n=1 Tax=Gammaproteobacteria bacterium LSUCC0057 TaxID=2559237 RepID=A0A4Y8UG45_9GAMM|nr:Crp/Fnr family transcriptional regulator [Gammaproteobacteria bacterium LSUCC0057]